MTEIKEEELVNMSSEFPDISSLRKSRKDISGGSKSRSPRNDEYFTT